MNDIKNIDNNKTAKAVEVPAVPMFNSDELFRGASEIKLFHRSKEYRLRITRNQKLILTK